MKTNIFCALDFSDESQAWDFYQQVRPIHSHFKIGLELFCGAGAPFVRKMVDDGAKIFLDLKFHDIPNTVAHSINQISHLGVGWINVHIAGGEAMIAAARNALEKTKNPPKLLGVTVLTSLSQEDMYGVQSIEEQTLHLARQGKKWGLDGVVCSAHDLPSIRNSCGKDFITVVPGIRLQNEHTNDQKRSATPQEAAQNHAHFIVMGRSIYQAPDPVATLQEVLNSL